MLSFFSLSGVKDFTGEFSKAEFLNLSPVDILGQKVLCCGACPVHCGMFSRFLDDPLEASSNPLSSQ